MELGGGLNIIHNATWGHLQGQDKFPKMFTCDMH